MTLYIDLIRALREPEHRDEISAELESDITSMIMLDAADEIERLEARIAAFTSRDVIGRGDPPSTPKPETE